MDTNNDKPTTELYEVFYPMTQRVGSVDPVRGSRCDSYDAAVAEGTRLMGTSDGLGWPIVRFTVEKCFERST